MAAGIYTNPQQVLKQTDILKGSEANICATGKFATDQGWTLTEDYGNDNTRLVSDMHVKSMIDVNQQIINQWNAGNFYLGYGVEVVDDIKDTNEGELETEVTAYWNFHDVTASGEITTSTSYDSRTCYIESIIVNQNTIDIELNNRVEDSSKDHYTINLNKGSASASLPSLLTPALTQSRGFEISGTSGNSDDFWQVADGVEVTLLIPSNTQYVFPKVDSTYVNDATASGQDTLEITFYPGELYNSYLKQYNTAIITLEAQITINVTLFTGE